MLIGPQRRFDGSVPLERIALVWLRDRVAIGAADFVNIAKVRDDYVYDLIMTESALVGSHDATLPAQPTLIS